MNDKMTDENQNVDTENGLMNEILDNLWINQSNDIHENANLNSRE